jgi:prepilin-type N-terminal cleavage/methylation domain-containing protein
MVSLKQRQSGFTIVELLIVIVIIGILATLVIVTFSGVQQKARDSERKTDINALAGQLEAGYANKGYYPTLAGFLDSTVRSELEIRIDQKAFSDPKNPNTPLQAGVTTIPTAHGTEAYNYYYTPTGCSDTTTTGQCTGYTVYAFLEGKEPTDVYKRESTN